MWARRIRLRGINKWERERISPAVRCIAAAARLMEQQKEKILYCFVIIIWSDCLVSRAALYAAHSTAALAKVDCSLCVRSKSIYIYTEKRRVSLNCLNWKNKTSTSANCCALCITNGSDVTQMKSDFMGKSIKFSKWIKIIGILKLQVKSKVAQFCDVSYYIN